MKVGDYVRTKGGIVKVVRMYERIDGNNCFDDERGCQYYFSEIGKASQNIIDLIEVGDFINLDQINGGIVINKGDNEINTWSILPNTLKNEDIKNVITREQLLNIKYDVEKI